MTSSQLCTAVLFLKITRGEVLWDTVRFMVSPPWEVWKTSWLSACQEGHRHRWHYIGAGGQQLASWGLG